jgi:hypothetical protein
MFVDSNNQVLPLESVIRQGQKDAYGKTHNEIVTPTVVAEARKLFGCPSLTGVPLENEGGNGTASAHWEYRWAAALALVCAGVARCCAAAQRSGSSMAAAARPSQARRPGGRPGWAAGGAPARPRP